MLRCSDVICAGEAGQFRANSDSVGWRGSTGTTVVHPTSSIRRAEWFEGRLRLLCETDGEPDVFALDGFKDSDFDPLWKFLEQSCGVYLKKHRPKAALEEGDFDAAMRSIEDGADRVDEATTGSVQKKAKEADLMKRVEAVRDGLDQAVSGDKQALSRVFAANGCERIGRLRLVVDTVQLEVYNTDPRWQHLLSKCATIEAVLKELGTFRLWKPAEGHSESLLKRAMVKELRHCQGDDEVPEVQETKEVTPPAPQVQEAQADVNEPKAEAETKPVQPAQPKMPKVQPPPLQPHPEPEPVPVAQKDKAVASQLPRNLRKEVAREDRGGSRSPKARESRDDADEKAERARRLLYTHPNSIFEGWVWKRSRFLKIWRRRWVVLLPGQLMSFKNRGDVDPTELVPAGSIFRVYSADGDVQQPRCFCVVVRQRNYYMVTDDETQKRTWMQEIEKALCKKQGQ